MSLSHEDIELIAKLFEFKANDALSGVFYSDGSYRKKFEINYDEYNFYFRTMCNIGSELEFINIENDRHDQPIALHVTDKVSCRRFLSNGGLRKYIKTSREKANDKEEKLAKDNELTELQISVAKIQKQLLRKDNKYKHASFWIPVIISLIALGISAFPLTYQSNDYDQIRNKMDGLEYKIMKFENNEPSKLGNDTLNDSTSIKADADCS